MTKCSLKSLVKAFGLGLFLSFLLLPLSSQEASQSVSEIQNTSETSLSDKNTALTSPEWKWSEESYSSNQDQPSSFALFFKMVFALSLVLVIAYVAIRLLKRGSRISPSDDPFLRHVSHLPLSASRSVDVVTILDHAYILGVSDNAVNLVGEITDKELVNSMNLYADKNDNTSRPKSFDDILSIFMPNAGGKAGNSNLFSSSAKKASESLRQQRNRLNEEE